MTETDSHDPMGIYPASHAMAEEFIGRAKDGEIDACVFLQALCIAGASVAISKESETGIFAEDCIDQISDLSKVIARALNRSRAN